MRGYALSAQPDFLAPYTSGVTEEKDAIKALQAVIHQLPGSAEADLDNVITQAHNWRVHYAVPTIDQVADREARGRPRRPDRQGRFRHLARQDSRAANRDLGAPEPVRSPP